MRQQLVPLPRLLQQTGADLAQRRRAPAVEPLGLPVEPEPLSDADRRVGAQPVGGQDDQGVHQLLDRELTARRE